jgi:phosphate transport system substrate-binding protein
MNRLGIRVPVAAVVVMAALAFGIGTFAGQGPAGATTYATVNGQGSTYAALAFQQWTQAEQLQGLSVNYTATGSPAGLSAYAANTADFAGTEAEYSELYAGTGGVTVSSHVPRGFAYTPDVAGATAIMYHVSLNPTGSDPVDYLQLSRLTVARIFMGIINNWDSPTITADNKGLVLPNKPITVDYRSGQSGTTALFYDFVKHTDPTQFSAWAQQHKFPTATRMWEVDDGTAFPPPTWSGYPGSTQQAQAVAGSGGLWSIGYDEFGYAKVYHDDVAWIENASGQWVQPYALNISAALQTAQLAADTSQTLINVYNSTNPLAYPISAYSYILYQCAPTGTRPTCKTQYANPGVTNTMAKFMRYIACTGQIKMATIGYSPLPVQLSQFMANAISYMTGQPPETLTVNNCANPQFKGGSLGVGALPPPNPVANVTSEAPAGSSSSAAGASASKSGVKVTAKAAVVSSGGKTAGVAGVKATGTKTAGTSGATGTTGTAGSSTSSAGGTTVVSLPPDPVAYVGPSVGSSPPWALLALIALLILNAVLLTRAGRRRRAAAAAGGQAEPVQMEGGGGPGT